MTVGMAGTFDVENYGDLLFPLVAAANLRRRDPRIRVVPFSVNGKSEPSWPFQVRPMEEMNASVSTLSALLIGGGQIVRFDKRYPVPVPEHVNMPVAYWLVPAVQAALAGKPVIWNAVGAWTGSPSAPRHDELIRQVFAASYFIGVRDAVSRGHLAKLAPQAALELLPDTAFGLSRLWPLGEESVEFKDWRRSLGLEGSYVVVQASAAVGSYRSMIESLVEPMENSAKTAKTKAVILPICWCHGDRGRKFPQLTKLQGRVFLNHEWLAPKLIAEIIGRSELVFASSLHACITALSYGVPGARAPIPIDRKFELLDEFEGIAPIDKKEAVLGLMNRGRRIEPRIVECADLLERYWDKVAEAVLHPPVEPSNLSLNLSSKFSRSLMLDWVAKACEDQDRPGFARRLVMSMRESLVRYFPNKRVALRRRLYFLKDLMATPFRRPASMGTPPGVASTPESASGAKAVLEMPMIEMQMTQANGNGAGNPDLRAERILNLRRIAQHRMETEPYQWAFINELFSAEDAALLAASFPHDKFKKVKGYDGEKGYEYMSRSLIHMGAAGPSYPEGLGAAWQALAGDLLSQEYRSALGAITGRDLRLAPMEVNVVHYGPGAFMGPHLDLKEKLVTHVLYFNASWVPQHGGCINILRSSNPADVRAEVLPVVGNSVLLVRSNQSWHSVSRVAKDCQTSRRSINVIFHLPGSVSTMWPPGEKPALKDYAPAS